MPARERAGHGRSHGVEYNLFEARFTTLGRAMSAPRSNRLLQRRATGTRFFPGPSMT